jgi:hypothetical protein
MRKIQNGGGGKRRDKQISEKGGGRRRDKESSV